MRLPIILMLLVILLLPADLRGFASDIGSGVQTVSTTIGKFLNRNREDPTQVAEAPNAGATVTR